MQSAILAHIWHEYQIEWSYSSSTTELVNEDSITNESSFWWICVAVIPQKWYIQKFAPSIQGHHTVKQLKTNLVNYFLLLSSGFLPIIGLRA